MFLIRVSVRLGEYDLESEEDCTFNNINVRCEDPPKDYAPSELVLHPGFNNQDRTQFKNDIALIRLQTRVDFSGTHAVIQTRIPTDAEIISTRTRLFHSSFLHIPLRRCDTRGRQMKSLIFF
jgi:hypothetical protein